jgi:hypothetical protein
MAWALTGGIIGEVTMLLSWWEIGADENTELIGSLAHVGVSPDLHFCPSVCLKAGRAGQLQGLYHAARLRACAF